jgi:hypothetical protein
LQFTKEKEIEELQPEKILANLGKTPAHGTVHGVPIEPFIETIEVKPWGPCYVFRYITDSEKDNLLKTFDVCHRKLKKRGLFGFGPIEIEIRPAKGRWAGTYKYRPSDETVDQILFKPESLVDNLRPLLFHECAHGIWFRMMNARYRAKWVNLYHETVEMSKVSTKEVERMGRQFNKAKCTVAEYRNDLGEDEKSLMLFDECIDWINRVHQLDSKSLNTIIEADYDILHLWPTEPLTLSDLEEVVTEYAKVKPEELFAEAFRVFMSKEPLPKNIRRLMERTLTKFSKA